LSGGSRSATKPCFHDVCSEPWNSGIRVRPSPAPPEILRQPIGGEIDAYLAIVHMGVLGAAFLGTLMVLRTDVRIRYAVKKMTEQMEFFESQGMNIDAPLWCGTIWMVENSALLNQCWDSWWDQNLRFGMMDQLSLPVLLEQFRLEPQVLPVNVVSNRYFEHLGLRK
jgi:hypothetical protein